MEVAQTQLRPPPRRWMTPNHTVIHPQKQEAGRGQSRRSDATMRGPVPNGPRSQARAPGGPCPASWTTLTLEEDPRPSHGGRRKDTKTAEISRLTQDQYLRTDPKNFQFFRIGCRWDCIPGRDQISVRPTLGLRKLPQASRSLQRARTREHACVPRMRQTPPRGPDRVLITPRPPRGVASCVALELPGHPPKGGVTRYPPRGVLHGCSRRVPGSCRVPYHL